MFEKLSMLRSLAGCTITLLALTSVRADNTSQFEAARVHVQKGRYEEALELYETLEKSQANAATIAIGKSRVYAALGRWTEAAAVLEKAGRNFPRSAPLWAQLAEVQFARGQYTAARTSVQRALQSDPDHPLARLIQADIDTETGRIKQALQGYRWFVRYYNRTQPTDADTLLLVARGTVRYARWKRVSQV